MIELAHYIVTTMKADFDPSALHDRERSAVVDLLKEKQRALPAPTDRKAKAEPLRSNIVSLMDALKKSLAAEQGTKRGASAKAGKRHKARSS